MALYLADDRIDIAVARYHASSLAVVAVDEPGPLLDVCHDLLLRAFEPDVVDPKEIYVNAVSDHTGAYRDYDSIFYAAVAEIDSDQIVTGFISTDLMLVGDPPSCLQLAVGNVATSPRLIDKELGDARVRGIGSTLLQAALRAGFAEATRSDLPLKYSTAEAEEESLPFWLKMGYKWPLGVEYYQPPLDFDLDGAPILAAVPETFVVNDLTRAAGSIPAEELVGLVRSIYWNWSLRPHVKRLSAQAFARAEGHVMGAILEKTLASIPASGPIPLVDPPIHSG